MKRRWLLKVGVLLVMGAIVNVAVAWGCAILGSSASFNPIAAERLSAGSDWVVSANELFGKSHVSSWLPGCEFKNNGGAALSNLPEQALPRWSRLRRPTLPNDRELKVRVIGG